jgi:hypothetical protein
MCLDFDRYAAAHTWVQHLGITAPGQWTAHGDPPAARSVSYGYPQLDAFPGWSVNVSASEPLPEPAATSGLAEEVAAAIGTTTCDRERAA